MTSNSPNILPMAGRQVDPDHLQSLGKTAARLAETAGLSLTDAVVQTLGHEKLNSEQVRRVVEHANIEAFNQKYASMSGDHRFVSIDDGPADPVQVLQSLGSAAQCREVVAEPSDYAMSPTKVASSTPASEAGFRTRGGVLNDVIGLQYKLASAHESVVQKVEAASFEMNEAFSELSDWAKRASLNGAQAGEICASWARVHPELAKVAAQKIFGTFATTKVAGRSLNPSHPVVGVFENFAKKAQDYQTHLVARQRLEAELTRIGDWLDHNRS